MNINLNKLKEPYVIVLIGPPLVGKSTWIKKNFLEKGKEVNIISRDQILLDVSDSDDYDTAFKNVDQKRVNQLLDSSLKNANNNEDNVIIDMTNMTSKRRRTTLDYFDDNYNKIAIIFPLLEWNEMIRRNSNRQKEENKTIPENVLRNMLSSYQPIRDDEGFDRVVSL